MEKKDFAEKYLFPNELLVFWKDIDGEIILLHRKEKQVYELTKAASFIWKAVAEKMKIEEIIQAMQLKYKKVKKDVIRKDTLDFINNLVKDKVLLIKNERFN